MEPMNYMAVFFASLLGYILGVGLGYIAPEELQPGHKYLVFLEKGLFVLTFLPVMYFFGKSFLVLLPLIAAGVLYFVNFKYRAYVMFLVFMVWFFLIKGSNDLIILLEASFIFLYGLPVGSLLLSPSRMSKLDKKIKVG